jgi:hypothetical protein
VSTTNVIAALGWALLMSHPEAITELDGHVVAFESQPSTSCSGAVEDFVFRVWPVGGSEAPSPFMRVRYVWGEDGEPPPDDLRSADRMWHIAVTRDPRCDANIDDLLYRKVLFEDGDATPLLVNFQPAPGRYAEALPTGAVLPCYVLRPGDAR